MEIESLGLGCGVPEMIETLMVIVSAGFGILCAAQFSDIRLQGSTFLAVVWLLVFTAAIAIFAFPRTRA